MTTIPTTSSAKPMPNPAPSSRPALSRRSSAESEASYKTAHSDVSAWARDVAHHAAAVTKFQTDVAALMKRTQVARNVLPMIVRGGAIASVGMLLFGHFAPIAILGTLLGAMVGGYLIAKFMQLRLTKQMQSGADAELMNAIREAPEGASAADLKHQQELLSFIDGGNVFKIGMTKAYAQPLKAVTKTLDNVASNLQTRAMAAPAPLPRPGQYVESEEVAVPTADGADADFVYDGSSEAGSTHDGASQAGSARSVKSQQASSNDADDEQSIEVFTDEGKGKGRADGKDFARQLLQMPQVGSPTAADPSADAPPRSASPLIDFNTPDSLSLASSRSSANLATLSTRGEQRRGLLSDSEAELIQTPFLQPSRAQIPVVQLSRSATVKRIQPSDVDASFEDVEVET